MPRSRLKGPSAKQLLNLMLADAGLLGQFDDLRLIATGMGVHNLHDSLHRHRGRLTAGTSRLTKPFFGTNSSPK